MNVAKVAQGIVTIHALKGLLYIQFSVGFQEGGYVSWSRVAHSCKATRDCKACGGRGRIEAPGSSRHLATKQRVRSQVEGVNYGIPQELSVPGHDLLLW